MPSVELQPLLRLDAECEWKSKWLGSGNIAASGLFLGEGRANFPGPEAKLPTHLLCINPKPELLGKKSEEVLRED